MEGTMAEIRMFAGNFAPMYWAFCDGSLLSIANYSALYSLVGTIYGGDGIQTFGLPDLRGRVPVGPGQGPGLPIVALGELNGHPTNTLSTNNLPAHSHLVSSNNAATGRGLQVVPGNNFPAQNQDASGNYAATADSTMNPAVVGLTGSGLPVNNLQPYLGMNYIICLEGIFPSRN